MDYAFGDQWSDDLRSRVQSWIDRKWATWGEESPGHELADFIQAKTMAEVSKAFLELALSEERAKELALELGELLRSHQAAAAAAPAATLAPKADAVKTAETVSGPSMKKSALEPFERTKPATGDHVMGQRREHVNAYSSLTSRRDDRDQHPVQEAQRGNDDVFSHSQLGKRPMCSEDEQGYKQQLNGFVRSVSPRQQQQQQSASGVAPITDQVRLREELNRVAVQSGFRNAQEILEIVYGGRAAPMMPPVVPPPLAAYPSAPYHVPYGGGRGGCHPYLGYVDPSHGYGALFGDESEKAEAVALANAVHAAQRIPQAMEGLSSVLTNDRMTFVNVTGEGETLEVCHFPRGLGMFPSFFDSAKQCEAVGSDLIFRRIQPVDEMRLEKTIAALKKGSKIVWCGHPGIGKSTEANFVLLEFLRHLGDGEDSEWPTKVAHRVNGQLYLYTWNAATGSVECDMLPGKTLDDVSDFSRYWPRQMRRSKKKPPVLFLELEEDERDPLVSIPTFIALSSDDVQTTLKTIIKSQSWVYFLVRPHKPKELLLMAKVMFEADPEQLCAHLECETEWDKVAEILSNRMGIVGPLVRHVVSEKYAFDEYVQEMEEIATTVVTSYDITRLTKFHIPSALQYFVAPYPLDSGAVDPMNRKKTYAFRFLSDHAAGVLAKSAMTRYGASQGLEFTEAFLRTVRTATGQGHPVPESDD